MKAIDGEAAVMNCGEQVGSNAKRGLPSMEEIMHLFQTHHALRWKGLALLVLLNAPLCAQAGETAIHAAETKKASALHGRLWDGVANLPIGGGYVFVLDSDCSKMLGYSSTQPGRGPDSGRWQITALSESGQVWVAGFHPTVKMNLALKQVALNGQYQEVKDLVTKMAERRGQAGDSTALPTSDPFLLLLKLAGTIASAANKTIQDQSAAAFAERLLEVVRNQTASVWENSLGMKFVPVTGTTVLFCIWETRVQDYEAFVKATGREWPQPSFQQGPTHPAVSIIWEDAKAFCAWLTEKERKEGKLVSGQEYRLPSDEEWSVAVGLDRENGSTPFERSGEVRGVYPWGRQWPPPPDTGNYHGSFHADNYEKTSPVGSFKPNKFGIYDMGGNAREWCRDLCRDQEGVLRNASWASDSPANLLSSERDLLRPEKRLDNAGFRCVLDKGQVK